jgi:hypothetical protein
VPDAVFDRVAQQHSCLTSDRAAEPATRA